MTPITAELTLFLFLKNSPDLWNLSVVVDADKKRLAVDKERRAYKMIPEADKVQQLIQVQ